MHSRFLASCLLASSVITTFAADPPKPELPKPEPAKQEAAKTEAPKPDQAKPKSEPPKLKPTVVLPQIPAEPLAKKKELLFSDDFSAPALDKRWEPNVVPTFTLEDGTFKGDQKYDQNIPAVGGKPARRMHQAVAGIVIPTKDSVVEMRFKFHTATGLSVEFDDRNYTANGYGHICMVRMTPASVILIDQRDSQKPNDAQVTGPDGKKITIGRNLVFPLTLDPEAWHQLVLETVGDEMRATIDGKPAGYLKASGIAHATKSKVEFGCLGKDGYLDDIKIWNAEPVK